LVSSRPNVPAIHLYLFLAKEARKRIPLLSGLARGLVFKRFWADELLCHPERSRRTASGSTIYNEILARASTSLSLTKMSITQSNKKNLLHLQNLRETFS